MDAWMGNAVLTCRNCGTELPSDAQFCWHCGTPVGQLAPPAATTVAGDSPTLIELHKALTDAFIYDENPSEPPTEGGFRPRWGWAKVGLILSDYPHLASVPYGKEQRTALHRLLSGSPDRELTDGNVNSRFTSRQIALERAFAIPGLDVNAQDREGMTPLHLAISCLSQLPFGNDDEDLDVRGDTFGFFQREFIKELLTLGADPNIPNRDGETPVHFAAERGREFLLYHLFKRGGDPNVTDNRGWTPMHYAHQYNYPLVIATLQEEIDLQAGIPVPLPQPIRLPSEE